MRLNRKLYKKVYIINAGVYAVKVKQAPLPKDKEGCSTMLIVGDLSHRIVDQLATLVDNIFAPLLTKPENHKDLPEIAIQDICKHVHALRGTLYQVIKQSIFKFFVLIKRLMRHIYPICNDIYYTRIHVGERSSERKNSVTDASGPRKSDGSREIGFRRGSTGSRSVSEKCYRRCRNKVGLLSK